MKLKLNADVLRENKTEDKSQDTSENTKKTGLSLSVSNLNKNNNQTEEKTVSSKNAFSLNVSSSQSSSEQPIPTEKGFSLSFTEGKEYNLDDIIFKKRRDNDKCPLIVKVDLNNANDAEVIKLITKLILSDYGIENVTDDNYKTLINDVPNFYSVFDLYFNRYYTLYYNELYNKVANGSISISTALEEIAYKHDYIDDLLSEASDTRAYANVFNRPKVVYEYGTSPDNYDGSTSIISDNIKGIKDILAEDDSSDPNDRIVLEDKNGEILEGQTPVYFKRINGESIFGKGDIQLMTLEDYLTLEAHNLILTNDNKIVTTSNDELIGLDMSNNK